MARSEIIFVSVLDIIIKKFCQYLFTGTGNGKLVSLSTLSNNFCRKWAAFNGFLSKLAVNLVLAWGGWDIRHAYRAVFVVFAANFRFGGSLNG